MKQARISVIGSSQPNEGLYNLALSLGETLAQKNYLIICGGLGGIMEAVSKGAASENGQIIGILPGDDIFEANPYITYPLATGLGPMRNYLVVLNGHLTIALGGGDGTLSEIGLALKIRKKVIAIGEWAHLKGVTPANDPGEAVRLAENALANWE